MRVKTLFFRLIAGVVILTGLPASVSAVTPQEMEEARTITAKIYLRCANPGSDYLEKVKAKTMSELEGKLKSKEKENLEAFKSVSVPTDYASWTKDDLVKYWSKTFYADPKVKIEAIGYAKKMTENAVKAMKVKAPGEAEVPKPEEAVTDSVLPDAVTTVPADDQTTQAALDTLAEAVQPVKDEEKPSSDSNNAIYIVLLCVLVLLVVVLIIYAARMFKRQTDNDDPDDEEEEDDRNGVPQPASNVNVTIAAPPVSPMPRHDSDEVESLCTENAELRRVIDDYKYRLNCIKSEKAELQEQVRQLRAEMEQERRRTVTHIPETYPVYAEDEPVTRPVERGKTLYLGRVNDEGVFVRAEREMNPAHTVYRLVSTDGITGTFTVVESLAVESRVMADVHMVLRGGCDCDFNEARGRSGVETVRSGTAIFDGGRWKVLRRAHVRFV